MTCDVTARVECSELAGLDDRLQQREDLLNASLSLLGKLPPRSTSADDGTQLKALAEQLQEADKRLKESLKAMKAKLAAELRKAENQKKLTAYSR